MWDLLRDTTSNTTNGQSSSSQITMWIVLGVIVLAFVGFFIWSNYNNKKQQKKHTDMLKGIGPGTKIITRGGISGVVESVNREEGTFILKTGNEPNSTYLTFVYEAIYLSGQEADKMAGQMAAKLNGGQGVVGQPQQSQQQTEKKDNLPLQ